MSILCLDKQKYISKTAPAIISKLRKQTLKNSENSRQITRIPAHKFSFITTVVQNLNSQYESEWNWRLKETLFKI